MINNVLVVIGSELASVQTSILRSLRCVFDILSLIYVNSMFV